MNLKTVPGGKTGSEAKKKEKEKSYDISLPVKDGMSSAQDLASVLKDIFVDELRVINN